MQPERVKSVVLPKSSQMVWYVTSIYNLNKVGRINFDYMSFGCHDFDNAIDQISNKDRTHEYLNTCSSYCPDMRKICKEILLQKIYSGEEKLEFNYSSIPNFGSIPSVTTNQRLDSMYTKEIVKEWGYNNGENLNDPFNDWKRFHHIKSSNLHQLFPGNRNTLFKFTDPYNPYRGTYDGGVNSDDTYFAKVLNGNPNNIDLRHSYVESPGITAALYSGELYSVEFRVHRLNNCDKLGSLFDINVVTGDNLTTLQPPNIGSYNNYGITRYGSQEYEFRRSIPIFTTFNKAIKFNNESIYSCEGPFVFKSYFSMPNLASLFHNVYLQLGPSNSDMKFNSDPQILCALQAHATIPEPCLAYYIPHNAHGNNSSTPKGERSGDNIRTNFGVGVGWRFMEDYYGAFTGGSYLCKVLPGGIGSKHWWNHVDPGYQGCAKWPNEPTYVNDENNLIYASLVRYAKNPYMLKSVVKKVVNEHNGTFNHPTSRIDFEYESQTLELGAIVIPKGGQLGTSGEPWASKSNSRNVILLKSVIRAPREGGAFQGNKPKTEFGYQKIDLYRGPNYPNRIILPNEYSEYFKPITVSDEFVLNRIVNELGNEKLINYYPLQTINEPGPITGSYVTFFRARDYTFFEKLNYEVHQNKGYKTDKPYVGFLKHTVQSIQIRDKLDNYSTTFYNFYNFGGNFDKFFMPKTYQGNTSNNYKNGFKNVEIIGPTISGSGKKVSIEHYMDYFHFGKVKSQEVYDENDDIVSKSSYKYLNIPVFENAYNRGKKHLFDYDYQEYHDPSHPILKSWTVDSIREYNRIIKERSAELYCDLNLKNWLQNNPKPNSPKIDCSYVPGGLIDSCDCFSDFRLHNDILFKFECYDFSKELKGWQVRYQRAQDNYCGGVNNLLEKNPISIQTGVGTYNPSKSLEYYNRDVIEIDNPFYFYSFFVPIDSQVQINYDYNCDVGLDSLMTITSHEYWAADYRGKPLSSGFYEISDELDPNTDTLLRWEPSFNLYRKKVVMPQIPGYESSNYYYYYYDLLNCPEYQAGGFAPKTSFKELYDVWIRSKARSIIYQDKKYSKYPGSDAYSTSNYYLYQNGWDVELDNYDYEEVPNPNGTTWPCPPENYIVNQYGYTEPAQQYFPGNVIDSAINSSIPDIPGLDTLYPYVSNTLESKTFLKREISQVTGDDNILKFSTTGEPIFEQGIDTLTTKVIEKRNWDGQITLDRNANGIFTRYYYSPVTVFQFRDCHYSKEFIQEFHQQVNRGLPVAVTVGFGRNDSLRTEYQYNHYNDIIGVSDPNGVHNSFEYDDYGRLHRSFLNNKIQTENEYHFWDHDVSDNFVSRTHKNFTLSKTFTNANLFSVSRQYYTPHGRESGVETDGYLSSDVIYDHYGRSIHHYRPSAKSLPTVTSDPTLEKSSNEYQVNPRSRMIKSTDLGYGLQDPNIKTFEYCYIDSFELANYLQAFTIPAGFEFFGQLFFRTTSTDQDGKVSVQISDIIGNNIVQVNENEELITLFEFNSLGQISKVYAPNSLLSVYSYNHLGQIVEKVTPDLGIEKFCYSIHGSILGAMEANGRINYFEYDDYGRNTKETKLIDDSGLFDPQYDGNPWIIDRDLSFVNFNGSKLLKSWIYEDYDRSNPTVIATPIRIKLEQNIDWAKGKLVQENSFDDAGLLIDMKFYNYNNDGYNVHYFNQYKNDGIGTYNWGNYMGVYFSEFTHSGQPRRCDYDLSVNGIVNFQKYFTYDHRSRLIEQRVAFENLGTNGHMLAELFYNDTLNKPHKMIYYGSKHIDCENPENNCNDVPLDTIYYTYDTRMRLNSISSRMYDEKLYYDKHINPLHNTGHQESYNGNISSISNIYKNEALGPQQFAGPTSYNFRYDGMNRLVFADAKIDNIDISHGITQSSAAAGDCSYAYDNVGNFSAITRYTPTNQYIFVENSNYAYDPGKNSIDKIDYYWSYIPNFVTSQFTEDAFFDDGRIIYGVNGISHTDYSRSNLPIFQMQGSFTMDYQYDAKDQRIFKKERDVNAQTPQEYIQTLYDASGSIIGHHDLNTDEHTWYLYGFGRIAKVKQDPLACGEPPCPEPPCFEFANGHPASLEPWDLSQWPLRKTVLGDLEWVWRPSASIYDTVAPLPLISWNNPKNVDLARLLDSIISYHPTDTMAKLDLPQVYQVVKTNEGTIYHQWAHRPIADTVEWDTLLYQLVIKSPHQHFEVEDNDGRELLLPLYRLISDRFRQDHPYEEAQVGNFSAPVPSFYIQDHLGNTRVTYEMDCGPQGARRNLEYVGDYLPYGGILREHIVDRRERFLTTENERDGQTQLDYRGARYSDSRWGVFMSVDPLAHLSPDWTPYRYGFNNPIRYTDPSGLYEDDPIYDKKGKQIGDDGKTDGKAYVVKGRVARDVKRASKKGEFYSGSLVESEDVVKIPTRGVMDDVISSVESTASSEKEHGGHALFGEENATLWDAGPKANFKVGSDGSKSLSASLAPFKVGGRRENVNAKNVEFWWHTHPKTEVGGLQLGSSYPSRADFSFQGNMQDLGYKGNTFVIGLRDQNVSFYNKDKVVQRMSFEVFKQIGKK